MLAEVRPEEIIGLGMPLRWMGDAGSRTLGQWIEKLSVTICQCQDKNWNWNPHVKEIHYESSFNSMIELKAK